MTFKIDCLSFWRRAWYLNVGEKDKFIQPFGLLTTCRAALISRLLVLYTTDSEAGLPVSHQHMLIPGGNGGYVSSSRGAGVTEIMPWHGPVRGAEAGQVDSSHTTHPKYLIHAHMETSSMGDRNVDLKCTYLIARWPLHSLLFLFVPQGEIKL